VPVPQALLEALQELACQEEVKVLLGGHKALVA
jgi:hypothetical protein